MRILAAVSIFALVALHLGVVAVTPIRPPKAPIGGSSNDKSASVIPNTFIIEYAPEFRAPFRRHPEPRAEAVADDIKVIHEFESSIFTGAIVTTRTSNIETLRALPYVGNVWVDGVIELSDATEPQIITPPRNSPGFIMHSSTGVDKIHAEGIFGKGAKIGIIDTGVCFEHPALGGGFGEGFTVAGGYDFVGDDGDTFLGGGVTNTPLDTSGHGTRVASVIAGRFGGDVIGVAPEATLYAYKVSSPAHSPLTSVILRALIAAEKDDVDIINISFTFRHASGWGESALSVVFDRLAKSGVLIITGAGNNGDDGPFGFLGFGVTKNVVAVAAAESEFIPAHPFIVTIGDRETIRIGYLPSGDYFPSTIIGWPIVALNTDTNHPADGCKPYPPGTSRLIDQIPLVRRGGCSYQVKQQNLYDLGAEFILIYNNIESAGLGRPNTPDDRSKIAVIDAEHGAYIIEAIKANIPVTADFSPNPESTVGLENPTANYPAEFTSWGMLFDAQLKPDIAAPGKEVVTADLDNSFTVASGTSLAAPYVAGVAALYISKHGNRYKHGRSSFARTLSRRIISSGQAMPWSVNGDKAPPAQVGNGLIDAWKVLYYDTYLEFDVIELNDTRHHSPLHDITVVNNGKSVVNYQTLQQASAGVDVLSWYDPDPSGTFPGTMGVRTLAQLRPKEYSPEITFLEEFVLQPGESRTIWYQFHNPQNLGWNTTSLPMYGGKIVIQGDNDEQLSVPYAGIGTDLRNTIGNIHEAGWPFCNSGAGVSISRKSTFSMNLSAGVRDYPKILDRRKWGTRELRWDIFDASWDEEQWEYPPVVGQNGYIGTVATWLAPGDVVDFDPESHWPDDTLSWPLTNVRRSTDLERQEYHWLGKLGDGSQIDPGQYKWCFASLLPFGDRTKSQDWNRYIRRFTVTGKYRTDSAGRVLLD
ncbi:Minor extracellular protease vpr [Colletotrichum tanaceti]|uniref:Minor extracellular protease vpr n=1 Tax=Colletotrichum tanaceti TaxID=1306861 RepID=A0A4U6XFA3_9PEZI|nr:Minor extracellular protease vpr [Colletotrichum tanaceti]TKW54214.1 Minor extracellular protease vpr [Colletotrichum tanaceti]